MLNVVCSEHCSESVMTCFVCKELTLQQFEGSKGQIYQTVKTVQQKLSRFYQFREWTVFSNSPIFMFNVVCSEFCSESVVTCFVRKELTLKEFEGSKGQIYQTVKTVQQKLSRF